MWERTRPTAAQSRPEDRRSTLCGRQPKGNEVIVLSAFDGIGADYHIPDVRYRGDITEDDPTKVATELKSIDPSS